MPPVKSGKAKSGETLAALGKLFLEKASGLEETEKKPVRTGTRTGEPVAQVAG